MTDPADIAEHRKDAEYLARHRERFAGVDGEQEVCAYCGWPERYHGGTYCFPFIPVGANLDQSGRVEINSDDPLYKAFRPRPETVAAIENNERANVEALSAIRDMVVGHVENWPEPKRFSTAIALIDKTLHAALSRPAQVDDEVERLREALELCAPLVQRERDIIYDSNTAGDPPGLDPDAAEFISEYDRALEAARAALGAAPSRGEEG